MAGLALYGLAYWLTYEPAPRIRVLWRESVTAERRAALERKYRLLHPRDRLVEGSVAYDLLDTSRSNVKALVEDPAVADTNDIEQHTYIVRFEADYGSEWMWIADRTPGLRDERVRTFVVVAFLVMAMTGLAGPAARRFSGR